MKLIKTNIKNLQLDKIKIFTNSKYIFKTNLIKNLESILYV